MTGRRGRLVRTPEHVELTLFPAGLGRRFLAFVADLALTAGASSAFVLPILYVLPRGFRFAFWVTVQFVVAWGYHVVLELRRDGRSFGKQLVGLRVVDGRGRALSLQQVFVRNVLRALDALPLFYGFGGAVALLDDQGRRLGDILADTLVVRERLEAPLLDALATSRRPSSLRPSAILRLARRRISLEEKEFLLTLCMRSEALEPRARFDLFEDVASDLRERLEIDAGTLSGERLVWGVVSILFGEGTSARAMRTRA